MQLRPANRRRLIAVRGVEWIALLIAGFGILMHEAYQPVRSTGPAATFPANPAVALDPQQPTLVLFAHPQCPCTTATLDNLDQLRTQANDGLAVTVVFTLPPGVPPGWEKGKLLRMAERMRGIRIVVDRGGSIARAFGVIGSGHVLVYARTGRLLFSGGITPARGHEGDNAGSDAIVELTKGHVPPNVIHEPVFGCTLL